MKGKAVMKTKIVLTLFFAMIIAAISWIMNFGFIRLFCTLMLIPFVHAVLVFAVFIGVINYVDCKKIRLYILLFIITYLISNVFLPDINELGILMFFGLVNNEILCNIGGIVSLFALIIHIILIILQIIEVRHIDKIREKHDNNL